MWEPQIDRFGDYYSVITVDVRGHGRTGATDRHRYSIPLFVEDLRAVLEREDVHEPVLCGLSMGGHIAKTYAHEYDVARLVLAGTSRTVPPIPFTRLQKAVFAPKLVVHGVIRSMGVRSYYESLLAAVRTVEGHRWVALSDENRRYVRSEIATFDTDEYIKVFDAMYDYTPPDYDAIRAPTLLVHGDHEAVSVVQQNRELVAELDATRVEIPGAGHLVNMDNPDVFDAALESFLAA